jgi:hypothetical protein
MCNLILEKDLNLAASGYFYYDYTNILYDNIVFLTKRVNIINYDA